MSWHAIVYIYNKIWYYNIYICLYSIHFFLTDDFPVGDSCHFQWVQWIAGWWRGEEQETSGVRRSRVSGCHLGILTGHGTVWKTQGSCGNVFVQFCSGFRCDVQKFLRGLDFRCVLSCSDPILIPCPRCWSMAWTMWPPWWRTSWPSWWPWAVELDGFWQFVWGKRWKLQLKLVRLPTFETRRRIFL